MRLTKWVGAAALCVLHCCGQENLSFEAEMHFICEWMRCGLPGKQHTQIMGTVSYNWRNKGLQEGILSVEVFVGRPWRGSTLGLIIWWLGDYNQARRSLINTRAAAQEKHFMAQRCARSKNTKAARPFHHSKRAVGSVGCLLQFKG